jgi:hypothetical protein
MEQQPMMPPRRNIKASSIHLKERTLSSANQQNDYPGNIFPDAKNIQDH